MDKPRSLWHKIPFEVWYAITLWRIGLYLFLTWPLRRRIQPFRVAFQEFVTPVFFALRKKPPWWD